MPIQQLVQFSKALSEPVRVRILAVLLKGEVCVCEIADALDIPQSSLSTHLQALRQSGIVRATKRGTWAYYAIEDWAWLVIDGLDEHFQITGDPNTAQDGGRLQARLALRENGCCVIGCRCIDSQGEPCT